MSRSSVFAAAAFALLLGSITLAQTAPATAPPGAGPAAGTPLPGMPTPRAPGEPTGTARIRGRIVGAQTGTPLRRAQVRLTSPLAPNPATRAVTTDADGRFEFTGLPAGRYSVNVSKAGYVGLQFGQRRPNDPVTTFTLADGERRDNIDVALPRGGVIVVRITDDAGEPLPGAQVQLQRHQYAPDGQRRLNTVFAGGNGQNLTDDRGETRLFGLAPGEYVIGAAFRNAPPVDVNAGAVSDGFATTFHPGTVNVNEAQQVTVALSEETLVEFAMSPARLARIAGTVVDSEGRPAAGSFVQVVTRQGNSSLGTGGGIVAPDGSFTMTGIAPGDYTLEARTVLLRPGATFAGEYGSLPITVAGVDITGIRIVTGTGATISGRVIYEGTPPRLPEKSATGAQGLLSPFRVLPMPADPGTRFTGPVGADPRVNGTIDENGRFELTGVTGRVFLFASLPAGWTIKSIVLDGQDITDEPLDLVGKQSVTGLVIRATDKTTQVSGQVSETTGQRTRRCTVVFQTAEERDPVVAARLMRVVRCDSNGSFLMRGMRPGRYVVTAVTAIEDNRQYEPEYRELLRRASQSLVLREGETMTLDLKLTNGL